MKIKEIAVGFMGFVVRAAILALCILAVSKVGKYAYDFGFRIFTEEPMSGEPGRDVAVTVVQGDSTMDVAEMFEEKGLIRDAKLFYVQKKCSVYDKDIQPGFYTLNTSMTAEDMFAIIAGRSDEEGEEGGDSHEIEATPLTEAAPLVEQTGLGEWEGSEEEESEIHDPFDPYADEESEETTEETVEE